MKNILTSILISLAALLSAQEATRPVLVEHFTNTYCIICATRNPALYQVIDEFGADVHHITYFPSVPYSQCPLYNYNTEGNGAREAYYSIPATPQVIVNGRSVSTQAGTFRDAITASMTNPARLAVSVEESMGTTREVAVTLTGQEAGEASDVRLFVAVVERNLQFAAQNGETEHFNVFRKMITANEGDPLNPPAPGEEITLQFSTTIEADIDPNEAYIMAYVQDLLTGEILGSGTRFDDASTSVENLDPATVGLHIFPNPAFDEIHVNVNQASGIERVQIHNSMGQLLQDVRLSPGTQSTTLDVNALPGGVYVLRARSTQGTTSLLVHVL